MAPLDVQLQDELSDGPKMTEKPTDPEAAIDDASSHGLLADDKVVNDTTPAVMSIP